MPAKKASLTQVLTVLVVASAALWCLHAPVGAAGGGGLTVRTTVAIPAPAACVSGYELAAFGTRSGGEADLLRVTWSLEGVGFFQAWYLNVDSPSGLLEPQHLQITPPQAGVTYDALTSYDPATGRLAFALIDRMQGQRIYSAAWTAAPADGDVYALPVTSGPSVVLPGFAPVDARWELGRDVDGRTERVTVFEPGDELVFRVTSQTGGTGEFRVVDAGSAGVLAAAPARPGEVVLRVAARALPLGPSELRLEYAAGSEVYLAERRAVTVGRIDVAFDDWRVDTAAGRLASVVSVTTATPIDGVQISLGVAINEMTWDAARGRYAERVHAIERVDVALPAALPAGTTRVPVAVALPDEPGLWSAHIEVQAFPALSVRTGTNLRTTFSTAAFGASSEGRTLRLCTYNVNHMQGFPESLASALLGTHAGKVNHFAQVLNVLSCDAMVLQEAGSQALLSDLTQRLGQNLVVYPSAQSIGALVTRYTVPQTRLYNRADPKAQDEPFGRYLAASLLDAGEGVRLWVVSFQAHPGSEAVRREEAGVLARALDVLLKESAHVVVMGDFGSVPGDALYRVLEERGFVNAVAKVRGDVSALADHVYVSPALESFVVNAWEVRDPGFVRPAGTAGWAHSDHTPVVVELTWP